MLRQADCPLNPWTVAARLLDGERLGVFLDGAAQAGSGGGWGGISLLAIDPADTIAGHDWQNIELALKANTRTPAEASPSLAPDGALIGSVDYDGSYCFGVFEDVLAYDHTAHAWWGTPGALDWLDAAAGLADPEMVSSRVLFREETGRDAYEMMVSRARQYIAAGDIYQVNLSRRFSAAAPGGAGMLGVYASLRDVSPAPFAAYLCLGDRRVASSSPELFLAMNDRHIQTRPIKGTRPRGSSPHEDARMRTELESSPKERAELIMITDLERNDLGQVCEFGSVQAARLLEIETFEHVHHMVSTVEGTLRSDCSHAHALEACLPGGSISGAPKSRAIEIIRELEPAPRGLYTGALGYLGFNRRSQLSIVIRTLIEEQGTLHFHTGAGIVADSEPAAEFDETTAKAAGLLAAAASNQFVSPRMPGSRGRKILLLP